MVPKYHKLSISDIDENTYKKLYSLNFRTEGYMREALVECKRRQKGQIIYLEENGIILGWVLARYKPHFNKYETHVYVRENNRKQGIGSKLMNLVQKDYDCIVEPHDYVSEQFFSKFKVEKI